jgi:hypothetical protein
MRFKDFKEFLEFFTGKAVKSYEIKVSEIGKEVKIVYEDGGFDNLILDCYIPS